MAKRVKGVTEKLLECAKEEFLTNGYENASLRVIAEKADSSKGAIYIRYPDKESLYRAIVQPAADGLCEMLRIGLGEFADLPPEGQKEQLTTNSKDRISNLIDYLYDYFDEFRILFTSGEKNAEQAFIHSLVEMDTNTTLQYIEKTGNDAITSGRLTPELAHLLSSAFYSGLFEVVIHNMTKEEAKKHIQRMSWFYNAGWKTIFEGGVGGDVDWTAG